MEEKSIYEKWFGVKPVIPLDSPYFSQTGGAYLPAEVLAAMNEAAQHKIDMRELLLRAGETVAEIIGAEAAFITSGCTAALMLASAAVMAGKDPAKIMQLPDAEYPVRLKNELIMQVGMYSRYVNAFRLAGAKINWVGGRTSDLSHLLLEYNEQGMKTSATGFKILPEEIEEAINDRTTAIVAAVHISLGAPPPYTVLPEKVIDIAKKHKIPTIVDAAHVPTAGGKRGRAFLRRYLDMGADLVCASGGKAIEGPTNTGIIYGKKDFVEAAASIGGPNMPLNAGTPQETYLTGHGLGRGFKVSKEQIVGFVAALKRYVSLDDDAVTARDTRLCNWMADQFQGVPHVKVVGVIPENDWPNDNMMEGGPSCILEIDEDSIGLRLADISELMLRGQDPSVEFTGCLQLSPWGKLQLFSHGLRDGEEEIVIEKLKKILTGNVRR